MKQDPTIESIGAYLAKVPRAVWRLVALGVAWAFARYVQEFLAGFFDGAASAR